MSGRKCKNCGSADIEVDPARGDAVCTECGTVLEDNIIVAEVEFQENAHGAATAIGQFVSAESKGGATGFGGSFHVGIGQESREVTIRKARQGITALCQQLRLNQQLIDIACNFFKMALGRHLTKGRPASHIHAACVYITCRTEGTEHLLIDISDVLQICCYQLGRTYLRLSQALCINIPSLDPCLYILRFSSRLQLAERAHDVSMTALRLVQRMKRDSLHSGRRPSGVCGAALLIAARLHGFSRTAGDVVRVVRVHESTLRRRLLEFGETPSSALTPDEFMSVDLEEEQDPPAFRAARRRDKDRLQKLMEEEEGEVELTNLQKEIEIQLEKDAQNKKKRSAAASARAASLAHTEESDVELADAEQFALQSTLGVLQASLGSGEGQAEGGELPGVPRHVTPAFRKENVEKGLGPDLVSMGLGLTASDTRCTPSVKSESAKPAELVTHDLQTDELRLDERHEADIDGLIMTEAEAAYKTSMWNRLNAGFLAEQKVKEERRAQQEEGKDKIRRKLRGNYRKKQAGGTASSAGEAIEKMMQEKRISSKINYDILRSLQGADAKEEPVSALATAHQGVLPDEADDKKLVKAASPASRKRKGSETLPSPVLLNSPLATPKRNRRNRKTPAGLHVAHSAPSPVPPPATSPSPSLATTSTPLKTVSEVPDKGDDDAEYYEDDEAETDHSETRAGGGGTEMESLASMLHGQGEDEYYDYDEY